MKNQMKNLSQTHEIMTGKAVSCPPAVWTPRLAHYASWLIRCETCEEVADTVQSFLAERKDWDQVLAAIRPPDSQELRTFLVADRQSGEFSHAKQLLGGSWNTLTQALRNGYEDYLCQIFWPGHERKSDQSLRLFDVCTDLRGHHFILAVLCSREQTQPHGDVDEYETLTFLLHSAAARLCPILRDDLVTSSFEDLVGRCPEPSLFLDAEGHILQANERWLRAMGLVQEAALGKNLFEFIHPDHHEICRGRFERVMTGHPTEGVQVPFNGNGMGQILMSGSCVPIMQRGRVRGCFAILRDLTEELELRHDRSSMAQALQATDEALILVSLETEQNEFEIRFGNKAARTLLGLGTQDLAGRELRSVLSLVMRSEDLEHILEDILHHNAGVTTVHLGGNSFPERIMELSLLPLGNVEEKLQDFALFFRTTATLPAQSDASLPLRVVEESGPPMAVFRQDRTLHSFNQRFREFWNRISPKGMQLLIGIPIEQLFRLAITGVTPDLSGLKRIIQGHSETYATQLSTSQGKAEAWFQIHFRAVNEPIPRGFLLEVLDITAQHETESKLNSLNQDLEARVKQAVKEAQMLQDALGTSPEGIALLQDGAFLYMNQAHAAMYGYTPDELIGKSWAVLYNAEERANIEKNAFPTLAEQGSYSGIQTGLRKNGTYFDAEISLNSTSDGQLLCFCNDVSEVVQNNRELARSNLLLKGLSELNTAWIQKRKDPTETFQSLLEVALSATGSQFGFLGECLMDEKGQPYLKVHALTNIAWNEETRKLFEDNRETDFELRNLDTLFGFVLRSQAPIISNDPANDSRSGGLPPGHPPMHAFLGVPIQHNGEMIGMIGLANRHGGYESCHIEELNPLGVTYSSMIVALRSERERQVWESALKDKTQELAIANKELETASRMKDRFLASMSHELRTPLSGILNLTEALSEKFYGPVNDKQLNYLLTISECGNHLLSLINDILDLSKISEGHMKMQSDTCSAREICKFCVSLVMGTAQMKMHQLRFQVQGEDFHFTADRRRLAQCLVNVLGNAVKFTPEEGEIVLEVGFDRLTRNVTLSVRDTGIGLPEGKIEQLFEPFVQADDDYNRAYEGTGLGLTLVRKLVQMHGGEITARNNPDRGSTFTITLPDCYLEEAQETPPETLDEDVVFTMPPLKNSEILVLLVEDNPTNQEAISDYLETKGFNMMCASDGSKGVEMAVQFEPDMILMDIQMPVMDGLEATKRIRSHANPNISRVPIIALTALAMPKDRANCLDAGLNAYLTKPLQLKKLADLMESMKDHIAVNRKIKCINSSPC